MKIAIYPGTFDPMTIGHLDIIERSSKLFDKIIVLVSENFTKNKLFTAQERKEMIEHEVKKFSNVEVDVYDGLVIEYASNNEAQVLIRGLRAVTDYENELTMAYANKYLDKSIETMFLMSDRRYSFVSSSTVKELAKYSDRYKKLVTENVYNKLNEKLKK